MTKSELITAVAAQSGETKSSVSKVIDALFGTVLPEKLSEGIEVTITGFGKFVPTVREARVGRNPASGEPVNIAEKMSVKFKPAADLKTKIN